MSIWYFLKAFLITFIIIYLLYLFTVILNKKKKNKIFNTNQARLIIDPNKLDVNKIDRNKFVQVISLSNSFIVALTFACSEFFSNYFIKLIVSFLLLIVLILIIYRLIGFIYKKKEGK